MLRSFTLAHRRWEKVGLDDPRLTDAESVRSAQRPAIGQTIEGEAADGGRISTTPVVWVAELPWTVDPALWPTPTYAGRLPSGWWLAQTQSGSFYAVLVYNFPPAA